MKRDISELRSMQALPLDLKVSMTKARIRQWVKAYGEDGCYVSFSGGKDSTVLLHLVRSMGYNDIPAVFVDVPTQYPELRTFAQSFENVTTIRPRISFIEVCEKYGFPLISKEVSECVYGARRYLREVLENVERERESYHYFYDKLTGNGKYRTKANTPNVDAKALEIGSSGGDNKYRKVRGIGEYSKRQNENPKGRQQSTTGNNAGNVDERSDDQGEYP